MEELRPIYTLNIFNFIYWNNCGIVNVITLKSYEIRELFNLI